MGFFDWLWKDVNCPDCGAPGAKEWGHKIKCPNRRCRYFDADRMNEAGYRQDEEMPPHAREVAEPAPPTIPEREMPEDPDEEPEFEAEVVESPVAADSPTADADRIAVRYTNYLGEKKVFVGDRRTMARKNNHIVLTVESGVHLTLSLDSIENRDEVLTALRNVPMPSPVERQILGYHQKHGTTSPMYEEIRSRFPKWPS